jgi:3-oxo-4-pregnene-20-carboxyl-CoA dehydrogenase beta subunit
MSDPHQGIADAERALMRDSLRGYLAEHWPVEHAVALSSEAASVRRIWQGLSAQGFSRLGADPEEGGLREIILAFEELGRASCPAPLLGAVIANVLRRRRRGAARALDDLCAALHRGESLIAVAFGAFDGDRAAGRAVFSARTLDGRIGFVEAASTATDFIVFLDAPAGAAIVPADAAGLRIEATPGLAVPALSELRFEATPAAVAECATDLLEELVLIARMACAARALGAAGRGFELALEHAKVRRQFGQLIGQFQALQHKLVDCLIRLDGSRLTLDGAATAYDRGAAEWRVFAAASLAFAGPMLRQVALEAHHAMGAIGYAEEHELPRHFRRVHADLARFGGVHRARAELADHLLGPIAPASNHP